ncbi:MAG: hypothetical protein XD78_0785 [Desulfotomaculum sp. 46_296]|nr:MAG: hypothetical protein XD78_0785 [Desulfotomaculum sp. 46_296]HAG07974.1 hypothetical protein [Desulfotomaculum sp.]HAU31599.1 hypothetical protein [Desulfotomaculum sp.]
MAGKLIVLIGPPAAGKSTWLHQFRGEVISTDDIRRDEFGVQYDPLLEPAVWWIAYKRLSQALAVGKEVCFDATNTTKARRKPLISRGKQAGASIEAIVFLQDLDSLIERNAARPPGKRVPGEVIEAKYRELEMPSLEEGFDKIKIFR